MEEKHICCICGKEFEGFGNNPEGAILEGGKIATWTEEDRCCDYCNGNHVIPGRLTIISARRIVESIGEADQTIVSGKLQELEEAGEINSEMHNFILLNWDEVVFQVNNFKQEA